MAVCAQSDVDPDVQLMLRVKQGEEEAFDELVRKYRKRLTGFFYSLCWNADTAQDCAQEVLLRLWLSRTRYDASGNFRAYMFRIARNQWVTTLRARRCRPEPMFLEEAWEPYPGEEDLARLLIRRYEDRRIKLAIADLPEHYRLVFVLSHFQGMKYKEIAEVLEIPVGTVKSRMSAAVRKLREWLMDNG